MIALLSQNCPIDGSIVSLWYSSDTRDSGRMYYGSSALGFYSAQTEDEDIFGTRSSLTFESENGLHSRRWEVGLLSKGEALAQDHLWVRFKAGKKQVGQRMETCMFSDNC